MKTSWTEVKYKLLSKWLAEGVDDAEATRSLNTVSTEEESQVFADRVTRVFAESERKMGVLEAKLRQRLSSKKKTKKKKRDKRMSMSSKGEQDNIVDNIDVAEVDLAVAEDRTSEYEELDRMLEEEFYSCTFESIDYQEPDEGDPDATVSIASTHGTVYFDADDANMLDSRRHQDAGNWPSHDQSFKKVGFSTSLTFTNGIGGTEDGTPLRFGVELIYSGAFSQAEKYFAQRSRGGLVAPIQLPSGATRMTGRLLNMSNSSKRREFPYAWKSTKPHPRDLLFHAEAVNMRVWLTGDKAEAKRALELYNVAADRAESAAKEVEAAMSQVEQESHRWWVLRFDLEDARSVYADATFWRSVLSLYTGGSMKGLYYLRTAWGCYEKSNIHKQTIPLNLTELKLEEAESEWPRTEATPKDIEWNKMEHIVCRELGAREYIGFNAIWRFGVGFFLLVLALAPPSLTKVLEAVGFVADRAMGLQLLVEGCASAVTKDENLLENELPAFRISLRSLLCMHTLSWDLLEFSSFADSHKELSEVTRLAIGLRITRAALERLPGSPLFLWLRAVWCRKAGENQEALSYLEKASASFARREGLRPQALASGISMPERMINDAVFTSLLAREFEQTELFASARLKAAQPTDFPIYACVCKGIALMMRGPSHAEAARALFAQGSQLQPHSFVSETEALFQSKARAFLRRSKHALAEVMYCELLVCSFAHTPMLLQDISRCITRLNLVLEQLEPLVSIEASKSSESLDVGDAASSGARSRGSLVFGRKLMGNRASFSTSSAGSSGGAAPLAEEAAVALYCLVSLCRVAAEKCEPRRSEYMDMFLAYQYRLEKITVKEEKWVRPYALYDAACAEHLQGNDGRANKLLNELKSCGSGYDGDALLSSCRSKLKRRVGTGNAGARFGLILGPKWLMWNTAAFERCSVRFASPR
ncbi:hypothetical protein FVE85_4081 [Porphyridium purpureum]|uniref:Uncharacterized protein n=1 Tax=Porphyridium purpureum TaxID=35688 RepID=A0A5J4YS04_PORPP|nr:hypothetical protein FVE85_4081 [Porphyridium purpureum]|eukprot:POR9331..scf229_5